MVNRRLDDEIRAALKQVATARPEFESFFRALASRAKNVAITELDRLLESQDLAALNDARGRAAAIEFFRQLEVLGAGQFRIGRRGMATRFIWTLPSTEVAAAGLGRPNGQLDYVEASVSQPDGPSKSALHVYVLRLRENLAARMELPVDLTIAEARRLTAFIETLPLDGRG